LLEHFPIFSVTPFTMSSTKKSADDFVSDFIAGNFKDLTVGNSPEIFKEFQERVERDYVFTPDEMKVALHNSRAQLEAAVGVPLTDEQLNALAGGKSDAGLYAGGGVAGAVGGGIAIAVAWTIFK
jgi:hypothetical protein